MIDIHSHILPGIDDGAQNVEKSLALLREMKNQGITKVVATPHFYYQEQSAEKFLENRQRAYENLMSAIDESEGLPTVYLGAEVYFSPSLFELDMSDFCINGSDYFLFELPYQDLTQNVMNQIYGFINHSRKIPIFAHLERFLRFTSPEKLYELTEYGALGQINCTSLLRRDSKRAAFKLIKNGRIQLIGTDAHNLDHRPPVMTEAKAILDKKFGKDFFVGLQENAKAVLNNVDYETLINI